MVSDKRIRQLTRKCRGAARRSAAAADKAMERGFRPQSMDYGELKRTLPHVHSRYRREAKVLSSIQRAFRGFPRL